MCRQLLAERPPPNRLQHQPGNGLTGEADLDLDELAGFDALTDEVRDGNVQPEGSLTPRLEFLIHQHVAVEDPPKLVWGLHEVPEVLDKEAIEPGGGVAGCACQVLGDNGGVIEGVAEELLEYGFFVRKVVEELLEYLF